MNSQLRRALPWLIAVIAVAVYANALRNGFALDDASIVAHNTNVQHFAPLGDAWFSAYWPNLPFQEGLYRPLTIVSYMVEWALWPGNAAGFHLVNVLLHGAVSALVVVLLLRLGAPAVAAAVGGVLFAIHPVHVEAVAGIVGYAELMSALFVLVACLVHLSRRGPAVLRWTAITACFLAALLIKETAVSLPLLLVIVDGLDPNRRDRLWRKVWADAPLYLLLGAVFGGYLGLRYAVLGVFAGSTTAPGLIGKSFAVREATAVHTWLQYLRLMLWPRDLVGNYGPNVIVAATWRQPGVYVALAVGLAVLGSAWALRHRSRWYAAGVAWFVASIFVVSNLFISVGVVLAERTFYLPSIGLAFIAVPVTVWLGRRARRPAIAVAGLLAALAVARVWTRTPVWHSTDTVLSDLAMHHPESFAAQMYIGDAAMKAGHPAEAVRHYAVAWQIAPDEFVGGSYASALEAVGDWPASERVARASCSISYPGPCLVLIDALLAQHKIAAAGAIADSIADHIAPSVPVAERLLRVAEALGDSTRIRSERAFLEALRAGR